MRYYYAKYYLYRSSLQFLNQDSIIPCHSYITSLRFAYNPIAFKNSKNISHELQLLNNCSMFGSD